MKEKKPTYGINKMFSKLESNRFLKYSVLGIPTLLALWFSASKIIPAFRIHFSGEEDQNRVQNLTYKENQILHLNYNLKQNEILIEHLKQYKKEIEESLLVLKKANSLDVGMNFKMIFICILAIVALVTFLMAKLYDEKNPASVYRKIYLFAILMSGIAAVLYTSIKEFRSLNKPVQIVDTEVAKIEKSSKAFLGIIENEIKIQNIDQTEIKKLLLRYINEYKKLRELDNLDLVDVDLNQLDDLKLNPQSIEAITKDYNQKLLLKLREQGFTGESAEVVIKYLKDSSINTFRLSNDQIYLKDRDLGYCSFWLLAEILLSYFGTTLLSFEKVTSKEITDNSK